MPRDKDDLSGLRRKRDRGRRLRTAVLSIISVVLVALLIGGLFLALDGRDTRIRLAFFNQDTVKQTLTARGLIVREEMQLLAPGSGLLLPLYSSGSRISKLDQVATVFLPGHEDSADRLHNLQRQIYHRQAELIRTDFTQPQVQKARELGRAEIAKTLTSARLAAGSGDVQNLDRVKAELEQTINRNSDQLRWLELDDPELQGLQKQYKTLIASLKSGEQGNAITCYNSGWLSFRNRSTALRQSDLITLDKERLLHELAVSENMSVPFAYPAPIGQDEHALTLITGQEQYLAFFLPELSGKPLNPYRHYTVSSLSTDVSLTDCKVLRQEELADGLLLILRTRQGIDRLADLSGDAFRLTLSQQTGLIMPVASLLDYAPEQRAARIMKIEGGKTVIVPVIVEATDGFYVLIRGRDGDPLAPKVADIYVRNPAQFEAGIVID